MDEPSMTDSALHDLLERAIGEPPPTTVNIGLARSQGQRQRHWRRVHGAAAVAAVAAVAVVAAVALSSGAGQSHPVRPGSAATASQTALAPHPPRRFSLSTPYASFGWLPAGFSAAGTKVLGDPDDQSGQSESIWASGQQPDGKTLNLVVNSAGSCRLGTGDALGAARQVLACGSTGGSWGPLLGRAPDVLGRLAYWDQHGNLVWEYGPGAWAQLLPATMLIEPHLDPDFDGWYNVPAKPPGHGAPGHPAYQQSAATRALLLKVAAGIRYDGATAQVYGFILRDVPASWRAAATPASFGYAADGRIVNTAWQAGPASDPQGLSISVGPAAASCKMFAGQSQYVTVDGVRAALRTINLPAKHNQDLCLADVDGLAVDVDLDLTVPGTAATPLPGSTGFGSAVAVFSHLRLLGPDVAGWTPQPVR
jgi:hypothetical protein